MQHHLPFGTFGQHQEVWIVYQAWWLWFCVAWVCHYSEIQLSPQWNETNSPRTALLTASGHTVTWWVWMGCVNVKEPPWGDSGKILCSMKEWLSEAHSWVRRLTSGEWASFVEITLSLLIVLFLGYHLSVSEFLITNSKKQTNIKTFWMGLSSSQRVLEHWRMKKTTSHNWSGRDTVGTTDGTQTQPRCNMRPKVRKRK